MLDVNLSSHFYLVRAGLRHLLDRGSGSIILTASELGTVGTRASLAYCAAKGGVVNLTRALAVDCKGSGVRVNCLAPGPIDTPMLESGFQMTEDPDVTREEQRRPLLLERFGRPDEVAEAALFLASDASSYMTGHVMVVDGGATAWYGF
jgi:NAD(P)-dependent dehydrogenase (short-subunit alcohol dehydrogenase family)